MSHMFSRIPHADIPRSKFNRSHSYTTALNSGYLYPIFVDEVLPGDTFNLKCNIFSRVTTLVVPTLDNIFFDTQFFFVPNRLIWENFKKFMGEQDNPGDSTDFLVPTINSGESGFDVGSLADYFGIPTGIANLDVNALPFRAYNLIYKEWYRDENLIDSPYITKADGPDDPTLYQLVKRGKRHDYFTSALPWPQKGPGVGISIGETAPVLGSAPMTMTPGSSAPVYGNGDDLYLELDRGDMYVSVPIIYDWEGGTSQPVAGSVEGVSWQNPMQHTYPFNPRFRFSSSLSYLNADLRNVSGEVNASDPSSTLYADLSASTPVSINSLRTAFQLQKFYERDARGGTRYTEIIRSHFGVVSPDARLQRPEYLGGSSSVMQINTVMQNSATASGGTPQGNLAAVGVLGSKRHGFTKSFVEHGYIIGLLSIRSDLKYQQGLNKLWSRQTREDFYWPTFAHLGEQAVLNKEIYAQGANVTDEQGNVVDDQVFGYQERYAEYRYYPSLITGKMRSTASGTLDVWHLAQKFDNLPTLNQTFIEENVPMSRVLAVNNEPEFKVDIYFNMSCVRPMPVYSVPGLVDHF